MKLAVYGLGRLGYPLFNVLARAGHDVVGIDPLVIGADGSRRTRATGMKPGQEPGLDWTGVSMVTSTVPKPADMSFIVVPTPSLDAGPQRGGFDSAQVEAALHQIDQVNDQGHIAVIVSTLSPGTCGRLAWDFPRLQLVYNPTFIALGQVVRGLVVPDLLLIGGQMQPALAVADVWKGVSPHVMIDASSIIHVGTYAEIELIKLAVNAALGTKISLANSLGELFEAWGVDPKAVEVVGRDPRIGTAYFTPGSPITGPCLPRDNRALHQAALEKGVELPLAEATDEVNRSVRERLRDRVLALNPTSVGILGMSYKYGSDVTEEALGCWLRERLMLGEPVIECYYYDELLGGILADTLACDVVVVTQREYRTEILGDLGVIKPVIDIWA